MKKIKRFFSPFLIITTLVWPISAFTWETPAQAAVSLPPVSASSFVVMDLSSQKILVTRAPNAKRPPASTEKLLTALVVMDRMPLNRYARVSMRAATASPTEVGLRAGEEFRIQDLLKACLIRSANDAAITLAEATAGSEWEFAQLMNQKARQLGCTNSRFRNATGLPDPGDQYTTSSDMARIMKAAHQNTYIHQLLQKPSAVIRSRDGRSVYFQSRNRLMNYKHPVYGKTGFTRAARHCFVGETLVGAKRVVVSVLGSHAIWRDLKAIIQFLSGNSASKQFGDIVSNKEIIRIQGALKRTGDYKSALTGTYDKKTIAAVKKFQKRNGLKVDGVVGHKTLSKLKAYL